MASSASRFSGRSSTRRILAFCTMARPPRPGIAPGAAPGDDSLAPSVLVPVMVAAPRPSPHPVTAMSLCTYQKRGGRPEGSPSTALSHPFEHSRSATYPDPLNRRSLSAHPLLHDREKMVGINRLGDIVGSTGIDRLLPVALHRLRG